MVSFLDALQAGPLLADGAMGSYIFERTGRLSEMNHGYEALSADDADLIEQAVNAVLDSGLRTADIMQPGMTKASTAMMGDALLAELDTLAR